MTDTHARTPRLQQASPPEAIAGVQQIMKAIHAGGVAPQTLELVHMRVSQINGCDACIASGITTAERIGLTAERLLALPAWRDSAVYDEPERSALAIAEAATRLADHPDAVTDEIWTHAVEHYDDQALLRARVDDRPDQLLQPRQHHPESSTRHLGIAATAPPHTPNWLLLSTAGPTANTLPPARTRSDGLTVRRHSRMSALHNPRGSSRRSQCDGSTSRTESASHRLPSDTAPARTEPEPTPWSARSSADEPKSGSWSNQVPARRSDTQTNASRGSASEPES